MVPGHVIASNLERIRYWLDEPTVGRWPDVATRVGAVMDGETREQFHSALIEPVPEFCEAIAPISSSEPRDSGC